MMTTVVLQVAGGIIGGLLGPVGAAIGSAIGAMGGYMIDTALIASTRRIEGPRLSGARPMLAEEGAPLPAIYGTMRVSGTLIWATRFEEQSTTTRQGAKGGPKVTTYSYYVNAAFAVAQGEISAIRRIWADGNELDQTNITMRVYHGSQQQQADPLIEAKQGHGKAPAYRGTAYVVFERLPVDDYGRRLPQLQFEVIRSVGALAQQIAAVALIPGATEFGLSPQLVRDTPRPGETRALNRNMRRAPSDWSASLDELQALCPHLTTVALIIPWFGTDLRVGSCRLYPGVTALAARQPDPPWRVGTLEREHAYLLSDDGDKKAYGGTPSDFSVIAAIKDARQRGLKVALYPFIMMDIGADNQLPALDGSGFQPAYPWRGRIGIADQYDKSAQAALDVHNFVHHANGYQAFIRHYLELAVSAGGVDGFLIGTELRGLTQIRNEQNGFPFVEALCQLAGEARQRLGMACKITYAADWSEYFGYHPQDGSNDVFFHLDPLWAHPAIDAVGIDNYMPLSDWRDGDERSHNPAIPASAYDLQVLQQAIAGGEGYDWYYASDADRQARRQTAITDGLAGKPWVFRYKDLRSWWQNQHFNRIGGVETALATPWVPMAKPFWFTELGCAAVDKGPNQPNVFPDPKSSENAAPYFSDGSRSDHAADRFLRAHFAYWQAAGTHNPLSPLYGGPMVDPQQICVWAWDTRPFPEYPLKADLWGDAANWATGHWLNGRLSGVALDELLQALFKDFGMEGLADCQAVEGFLGGFIAENPASCRAVLEPLLEVFAIAAFEQASNQVSDNALPEPQLIFRSLSRRLNPVALQDFALEGDTEHPVLTLEDADQLPASVELYFNDGLRDYQAASALALKQKSNALALKQKNSALALKQNWQRCGHESLALPAVLDHGQAQALAENWLERKQAERRIIGFSLPWSQAALMVGDRIILPQASPQRDYIITAIEDGAARRVSAVALAPVYRRPDRSRLPVLSATDGAAPAGPPLFYLLDLPMGPGADQEQNQFKIACYAKPWRQMVLYSAPQDSDYQLRSVIDRPAMIGELQSALLPGPCGRWLHQQSFDVQLFHGALQSKSPLQVLNAGNTAVVQAADGQWEILQFVQAQEIAADRWRLQGLLRGQLGTDALALSLKPVGAAFIALDERVIPAGLTRAETGLQLNWRAGASGHEFSDEYFQTQSASGGLNALRPLMPVHLRHHYQANGALYFHWIRRGRLDADRWTGTDIPLGEAEEHYQISIWRGTVLLRRQASMVPSFLYSQSQQLEDGVLPGEQMRLEVAQISQTYGIGAAASLTFRR